MMECIRHYSALRTNSYVQAEVSRNNDFLAKLPDKKSGIKSIEHVEDKSFTCINAKSELFWSSLLQNDDLCSVVFTK